MTDTLTTPTASPTPNLQDAGIAKPRTRRRIDGGNGGTNWWLTALIAVCSLTVLIPLYFTVVTALKTPDQLGGTGFELPTSIRWENFADAYELTNFPRALLNTALITVGAVFLTLLTNSLVAYAIARNMHRKFFKGLYFYFLAAIFVPFPIIMLPVVKETAVLGIDTPVGLILLYTVYGLSFNIFIFVAYINSIPVELEEAARLDGASTWTVFWKVIFPLLSPMNATVGILTCVWAWNDFLLPLVVLSDPSAQTLPLAQFIFQGQFNTNYPVAFASYLMALAPLLVVYVIAQKWVVSGVTRGSVK
ncbi:MULTISPECIES: carbohydrate ABC transporter permease [unclassified Cryobacterium]|uniref:carbohydrate ABC transporter permease n=1 Tax=unclassified Cryobacterium TaxID=2649013 RepID=UPI00106D3D6D|nr:MULTISPECIES: carbohydrate ABC transporter permease [unclassified Cryobacterium]TFB94801.1 carbohydrate ABC transporter permease [Cryobacterium sp. MDB2-A-1]TFC02292.1 carbohydrate ABC transporter permease [Cryobacterium sp. MDB2-33-2]TFC16161.1 carbohydrate ABC transporter permease [Cryobacterium sp. MDB2-A-2]TFC22187.1 carbohydrate ABC transporter permease [Cryobacterium sp. MDB2-10]TFC30468.1 carbohydrate ABC transporter permease [Cryobacterium sp. MDB1-18-2]